ncbi:MAG: NAD-dependent epimerase/dehydratase family protein [Acidobacteria bacterium]|nr:NAD-dependent epimerase/dehydratase family protein [Acidobacteriota bacterium]MDW7984389.1 NAD-dependent epimerase/dehydratase family protein [Acidobacteriota bacterium]
MTEGSQAFSTARWLCGRRVETWPPTPETSVHSISMRVFLTGATGYVGSALLEALLRRGTDVTVLVRDSARLESTGPPDRLRVIPGDLLQPESYEAALRGADAVVHMAALVRVWSPDPQAFERVNVEATEDLIRRALEAGVARVLYTSTFFALGPGRPGQVLDETAPTRPPLRNPYRRTKVEALYRVRRLQSEGASVITLFPGVVYGPGRITEGNFVAGLIRDFLAGRLPGYIGRGHQRWCFAWIHDVVQGFLHALERGTPGREYILGGENRTVREFFHYVAAWTGRRPLRWPIPGPVVQTVAGLQFALDRLRGRPPRLSPSAAGLMLYDWAFTSERACRELGYTVTSFEVGLRQTVEWLLSSGTDRCPTCE